MQNLDEETLRDDFDSPWKEAVERYFSEFMDFYFPAASLQIDWKAGFEFLEQELQALTQDAELGKRFVDKLAKVALANGDDRLVYIHIEVQGSVQSEFAERMYTYNYRVYDHYKRPVASMAVLADEHPDWKPDCFSYEVLGCRSSLTFPVAKLQDYQEQLDNLLTAENTFAIITAAHILTQRTRQNPRARYEAKFRLIRLLYQKQWERQRILDLLWVLDWLMRLPDALSKQLRNEIETLEESEKMRYVTSFERLAREEGLQKGLLEGLEKGLEKGIEKGLEKGLLEGEIKLLKRLMVRRFGELPTWVVEKLTTASEHDLENWGEAVLTASSLNAVFDDNLPH